MLRAPITLSQGLVAPTLRDEFNQSAGALSGKSLAAGGTWSAAGDADDFTVNTTDHTARRTAVSDTGPHFEIAGSSNYTDIAVQTSLFQTGETVAIGVFARYTDTSNHLRCYVTRQSVGLDKVVAGSSTSLGSAAFDANTFAARVVLTLQVTASGQVFVFINGNLEVVGFDPVLATGGTLATGKVGLFDWQPGATAATRDFDNFNAWVPISDAVIYASRSLELNTLGINRQDTGGTAYGPVPVVAGDIPRMPNRSSAGTVEFFAKASRGDMQQLSDPGVDDVSVRVYRRASYLTVG